MNDISIVPAILETTEEGLAEKLANLAELEEFRDGLIQIDLADGEFVPNKTIGVKSLEKANISFPVELHLMVKNPLNFLAELPACIKRVIVHMEANNVEQSLVEIKQRGLEGGLAVNPQTDIDIVQPYLSQISVLQIMAIDPGFQGTEFIPDTLNKIKQASQLKVKNDKLIIEVDGGLSAENVKSVVEAGADGLVIGSHLVYGDITQNLEKIWEAIYA